MDFRSWDRLDFTQIQPDDTAHSLALLFPERIDPWHSDLAPTTRRAPQIDNPGARHQKSIFIVDFQYLVSRSSAITIFLCARDIGVI